MKKRIITLFCLILVLALTGCGDNSAAGKPGGTQTTGVNDVLEQGMAEADGKKADNTGKPGENSTQKQEETKTPETPAKQDTGPVTADSSTEVDIDLTVLSSTMVYSEVYNMVSSSENYIGKTVKMKGPFAYFHDEGTDNYYFACIIKDATACCAQGIEFVLTDDYVYPDDYPQVDEEICVVGVFDTYREGNYIYCTLRNAKLI